ncbi:MAG TPA: sialidase family protein, partial [Chthonomonadaceae bacterium]|nr:sialidase family protein [Chthonomonadaceae bacterium]
MNRTSTICCALAVLPLVIAGLSAAAQPGPPLPISGMVWRSIGPFRGGRVAAVTGVVGQPGVYYMGMPAGGVWKTTSAGTTWYPVFDSVKEASSVGAIEVAPSDPSVIYVGMGDMITGGAINRGNGVYKSIDGGATWRHMGLEKTEHIPSIVVDPHDPNTVLLAAQGSMNARSDARGIYRSTDGGTTWTKTLALDDVTGAQKIARAFDQPNVLLATTMRYYTPPGQARGGGFGGRDQGPSGTRIFKSIDNGVTWTELKGGGLPALTGRTCVAVAMHTNAQRMFLVGNFGLYRSDNGGSTWRHMDAEDRRVANGQGGYNCGVYVNSQDPDVVYVINTCSYRSTDGGRTFTGFKGAPGGDDPQQMWLDPTDGNRLFLGTDQGATVSLDGGKTWSSWYNQATAQVYHISVDNQFPYWVYATQQDSGSI